MKLAVVVCFLNEEKHLAQLLASVARQTEPAEKLLLVDDGSQDSSAAVVTAVIHDLPNARLVHRPPRAEGRDRLVDAPEVQAFQWGVTQLKGAEWEIVCKMDGDLELPPTLFAEVRRAFSSDPRLGITGSFLSIQTPDGRLAREHNPTYHVRGPNKFYRRECFEMITPLPALGAWDTIDELRARRAGWRTRSFIPETGTVTHLRPTGAHNGRLRARRRWGSNAWEYGAGALWVAAGGLRRMSDRPYGLAGLNFWLGWLLAAVSQRPRAEAELIEFRRREDRSRLRRRLVTVGRSRRH